MGSSPSLGTTGCGLDGKAPRLGRGDPQFESGHPDHSTLLRVLDCERLRVKMVNVAGIVSTSGEAREMPPDTQ